MSDTIQTNAPNELAGGQAPLTQPERTGASDVNSLSFCRGVEVPASSGNNARRVTAGPKAGSEVNGVSPINRPADLNSGLCVSGRAQESAKPVDANHLEGSNKGDHRAPSKDTAKASLDSCADNGGPRAAVGQFRGSKFEQSGGFQSFPGDTADSDAGN